MPSTTELPLQDLLDVLEAAVLGGYREQAQALAQAILRRIASEGTALERAEVQVRTLLLALEIPAPEEEPMMAFSFGGQASAGPGVVYPVWYGTNRKPAAGAGAFTHERHTGTTLGRALVHIPDAHRPGETGSRWWTRMRRFDFRDDRLRVQSVETRDRAAFLPGGSSPPAGQGKHRVLTRYLSVVSNWQRLFLARPAAVLLEAIGSSPPAPRISIRAESTPSSTRELLIY